MNVLLLTSAMIDNHFSTYQNNPIIKPNPSNQMFYSKLIKALSYYNNLAVVTHRPFTKGMFTEKVLYEEEITFSNVKYFYTKIKADKIYKLLSEKNEILKQAHKAIESFNSDDFIVVTDTLRYSLVKAALELKKEYNVKVVGMLTDNHANLSNVKPTYVKSMKKLVSSLDGYLSLTHGLVENFNSEKPSYIFSGLVADEELSNREPIYDYYFFSGSLYERYGVKTMVDAFHESNSRMKLVIAGSGPLAKYIEKLSSTDYRILYLTQLSKEKILRYQANARANINPRPLNSKLDQESVPSKMFEYLSSGVPTISTKFPVFSNVFKDDIIWIEDSTIESMKKVYEDFEKTDINLLNKKASAARAKVFEFYGIPVQAESIAHFLSSVNSSNN